MLLTLTMEVLSVSSENIFERTCFLSQNKSDYNLAKETDCHFIQKQNACGFPDDLSKEWGASLQVNRLTSKKIF